MSIAGKQKKGRPEIDTAGNDFCPRPPTLLLEDGQRPIDLFVSENEKTVHFGPGSLPDIAYSA